VASHEGKDFWFRGKAKAVAGLLHRHGNMLLDPMFSLLELQNQIWQIPNNFGNKPYKINDCKILYKPYKINDCKIV
jgi:hypothetical protein